MPPKYLPPTSPPEFLHLLFSHLKSIGSLSPPHKALRVCWQRKDGDLSVWSSLSPLPTGVWTHLLSSASPLPSRPIPACLSVWDVGRWNGLCDCATILISLGQGRGQGRGAKEALPAPGWCSKKKCMKHKQRDRQIQSSERADNTDNSALLATNIKCPLF